MQCDNCGYIFFQPSKKCSCCSAPYVPTQSSFDVGQENLFTIFEMAPGEGGIPGGMGMSGGNAGLDDYNFTDDFDAGGAEYGVDENVLDLSDAEAEGFGADIPAAGAIGAAGTMAADDFEFDTSDMDDMPSQHDVKPDDFDLSIDEEALDDTTASVEAVEDESAGMDYTGGFDEVEGLGFGFDEPSAEETPAVETEEVSMDTDAEPEISLEPELELGGEEEPSLELPDDMEAELDIADDQPSLELSDEPSLELPEDDDTGEFNVVEEDGSMELPDDFNLDEEPELMETATDESAVDEYVVDEDGVEFDLDSVNLDEPEDVSYEVPETETDSEEAFMDLEGLEMESSDDPEDEELKP